MSVKALIKFTQGALNPPAGQALFGTVGTSVVATNADNSGVKSFTWTMIDVPPGSAISTGVLAMGNSPSLAFLPDLMGGYDLELEVRDKSGFRSIHRLVFQVKLGSGRYIPPFGAPQSALNFAGNKRGWAPSMEEWLLLLDSLGGGGASIYTGSSNNAAPATILIPILSAHSAQLNIDVLASRQNVANATATWTFLNIPVRNVAGTAAILDASPLFDVRQPDGTTYAVVLGVNGGNVTLVFTGTAGHNVDFKVAARVQSLGGVS